MSQTYDRLREMDKKIRPELFPESQPEVILSGTSKGCIGSSIPLKSEEEKCRFADFLNSIPWDDFYSRKFGNYAKNLVCDSTGEYWAATLDEAEDMAKKDKK